MVVIGDSCASTYGRRGKQRDKAQLDPIFECVYTLAALMMMMIPPPPTTTPLLLFSLLRIEELHLISVQ